MDHRSQSTADYPIRLLTVLAWIPAFAFLLPHGLNVHQLLPALGILPMTFSACTSIIHLAKKAKPYGTSIAMDLFCACFLIGVFVPACTTLAGTGHALTADTTVVGTLGLAPMMLNIAIHSWFVLRELNWRGISRKKSCPHCHKALSRSRIRRHRYSLVDSDEDPILSDKQASTSDARAYDDEDRYSSSSQNPRPSTDSEVARLV